MSQLQRTSDEFTTGVVNVPQNTPAYLIFITTNDNQYQQAFSWLNLRCIEFRVDTKRKRRLLISKEMLKPEVYRLARHDNVELSKARQIKRQTYWRYVFFELDTLDDLDLTHVLNVYAKYQLPVYYHRTMRGYHFFCVKPVVTDIYDKIMSELKPLNPLCPHITLRIQPNKWVGEKEIFKQSKLQMYRQHDDTLRFRDMLESEDYYKLMKYYLVVHYRQTGEMGNL